MTKKNINTVIDLGSNKLKSAIFDFDKHKSKLIAYSEIKTSGINNSLITNFDQACESIRTIITDLEKKAGININIITVLLEPTEIITTRITKFKKMEGVKIENEDINFLLRESKKQLEKNDKNFSQLHMFNFKYIIDNKVFKDLPINIFCNQLSLENIFISVPKNVLKNISEVFNSCNLEINRFICPSYAMGIYLLNKNQLENGSGIIDIGYDKTSIALFKNSSLIKLLVLPIGSNHITKDISKVCYLDQKESESIKLDFALFSQFNKDIDSLLPKKYFINSNYRKIPLKLIHDVIESRISEIIEMINIHTNDQGGSEIIKKNLLIVGGGANILGLIKILNLDIKYEFIETIKLSNKQETQLMSCNSAQNLFVNGCSSEAVAISMEKQKKGIFTRFFQFFN